jgi:hypothetical protein
LGFYEECRNIFFINWSLKVLCGNKKKSSFKAAGTMTMDPGDKLDVLQFLHNNLGKIHLCWVLGKKYLRLLIYN